MILPGLQTELAEGSRELALAGAALTLAGLALTPICAALARRFSPKAPVFFARWRFFHAALVALLFALCAQVAMPLVALVSSQDQVPKGLAPLLASVFALGVPCCIILNFAARLDPEGISSLGLRAKGSLRAAALGIGCYVLLASGILGISFLWPWLLERIGGKFVEQDVAVGLESLSGDARVLGATLVIAVLPFFEELLFRGFLQPLFVQNLGDRGGVFLTSLIFAVLHGDSAFLPIFGLALLLGSLKLRTQRLSASYAVHALHNAIVFLMLGYPGNT